MIDWKLLSGLLVNQKLEEILQRWFGMGVLFVDASGKIHTDFKKRPPHGFLAKQFEISYGPRFLEQDIETLVSDRSKTESSTPFRWEGVLPGVSGMACPISYDGEFLGMVVSYGFCLEADQNKFSAFAAKLSEAQVSQELAQMMWDELRVLSNEMCEYARELVGLLGNEVITFQSEIVRREERIHELNSEMSGRYRYHNMIGKSKTIQAVYRLLEKVSRSESTILIQGENGTGKELVAKAIHYNSPRKDSVFVAQNCSAFNDNLLDSELFGHVKGSFTGAVKDKKGLFEVANGGTLFLDEIGDTSLAMQVKLLRVLQEGTFLPVGATTPKKVNVRVIAATNKPLKEMIQSGEFREDLYYRLNVINVALPPLRERREDVMLLADHFLDKRCAESGQPLKQLSKKVMEIMLDYKWPGNVRELENEIERLVVLAGDERTITEELLSQRLLANAGIQRGSNGGGVSGIDTSGKLKSALEEVEKLMIAEGLKRCNFNKSRLAKELGISRAGLIMKVDKYNLDKRAKKAS